MLPEAGLLTAPSTIAPRRRRASARKSPGATAGANEGFPVLHSKPGGPSMPTLNLLARLHQSLTTEAYWRPPPPVTVAPRLNPRRPYRRPRLIRHRHRCPIARSASPMTNSPPCSAPPSPWRSATAVPSCRTSPRPCKAKSSATGRCTGWSHRCSGGTTTRRPWAPSRDGDVNSNSRATRLAGVARARPAQRPLGREAATRNELVREFWRESPPKRGPVAGKREIVSGGDRNSARANPAIPQSGCTQPGAEP